MPVPFIGPAWGRDGEPLLVASLDGRGYTQKRHLQRTRLVVDDYGNAVAYRRRCSDCVRWMPIDYDHFAPRSDGKALGAQNRCNLCCATKKALERKRNPDRGRARNRAVYRRMMADPDRREAAMRRMRDAKDAERERDPDGFVAKRREACRRYREKLKQDPERLARYREAARMANRLRTERRSGVSVDEMRRTSVVVMPRDIPYRLSVPGVALAAAIRAEAAKADQAIEAFCDALGFPCRTLHRWEHNGEDASVRLADSALTNMGLCWWEVWTPEDPASYERARRVFEATSLPAAA